MAKAKNSEGAAETENYERSPVKEAKAPLYKVKTLKATSLTNSATKNQGHACKKHYRLFEGAAEDG